MRVLVIGSGGREHAIVWKIAQSKKANKIFAIPGNGGIYEYAECHPEISPEKEPNKIVSFVKNNKIDLTIVGPENPLASGLADKLEKNGLKVFGPVKEAAKIEASKSFAKKIMTLANVPTAQYAEFTSFEKASDYLEKIKFPVVIKADGLAKGKGVFIVNTLNGAKNVIKDIMINQVFGSAGNKIIIEEFLKGKELTVLAFTDGKTVKIMPASRDYKRALDNDKGLNTGGMGAFAPVNINSKEIKFIKEKIIEPVVKTLKKKGIKYKGVIYAGLIKDKDGYKVLEFNCRFGDPETQVVLPLLKTDLLDIMMAVVNEKLNSIKIEWEKKSAVTVVAASAGYPEAYKKLLRISGLRSKFDKDVILFHAGTIIKENICLTNGGRVLNMTGVGKTKSEALKKAYKNLKLIYFKGMRHRKDIGK